ncbi:MAG: UvrD-helicase domain-containing protein, partial [Proteobacteria bacterium]|nr:UvrD-helicase domain-containing protein [Pseudomonadota bacterium]
MSFYADLHIHSKYSRATSRDCDLEHLAWWAARKGIGVVGTGDFTHPAWFEELRQKLVPAEPGLFRLRDDVERETLRRLPPSCRTTTRFMLSVEISTIYKKGERTRKIHHLVYAPDFDTAERFNRRLGAIGNIASDGRPILGLDSRHLLEIALESGDGAYLVPAHIWTPWFAVLGSKSGFDAVDECYGDLAEHIFAVETGLSSDPAMNWRVSSLDRYRLVSNSDAHSPPMLGREACRFDGEMDYFAMRRALETGDGYGGTVEFFPEEGKYHLDGHRKCGVRLEPSETRLLGGDCPACGKPVTVGVLSRVEALADRPPDARPAHTDPFRSLVPLPEIVSEIAGVGPKSKRVAREVASLVDRLGPELSILECQPVEDIVRAGSTLVAEAVARLRRGEVVCEAGFDGEYGRVKLFEAREVQRGTTVDALFEAPPASPPTPAREAEREPAPSASDVEASETAPGPVAGVAARDVPSTGLVAGLDPEQRAAATSGEGPLLILAGPGTGKTRTLVHRLAHCIAERGVPPAACLALTFTRRAAEELETRLAALLGDGAKSVLATTFHGLGLRMLQEQRAALGLHRGFRIADEAERAALVRELSGASERGSRRLVAELSRWKRSGRPTGTDASTQKLAQRYQQALAERSWVDFDDLIALPVGLLEAEPDVVELYRERYRWIFIDEYQDVDELQYRLVRQLAPSDGNVCAIGDPDQAIYGFRGADVGFFLRFQEDFHGARVVRLTRNYRSSPAIVDGALQAIAPETLVRGRALEARGQDGASARIAIHAAPTERAEAEFVVHAIERLIGGSSYFSLDSGRVESHEGSDLSFADFAVLYRTDAQSESLSEALLRSGMPFQKRSHDRLLDRPGVRVVVQALRRASEAPELFATPPRTVVERLRLAEEEAVLELREGDGGDPVRVQPSELALAAEWLEPLARRAGADVEAFLSELALGAEIDTWDPRADRVSLLTLHAAKGLEFPVVFLTGFEDGLLPLRWPSSAPAETAEERRLFFVGMTRAKSHLFLSHA